MSMLCFMGIFGASLKALFDGTKVSDSNKQPAVTKEETSAENEDASVFDEVKKEDGKKGIEYDINMPFEALASGEYTSKTSENDNGIYLSIYKIDEENELLTRHLLRDRDKDGIYDSYRYENVNENGDRAVYDDLDFDGTFDRVLNMIHDNDGNLIMNAVDNDADGVIDFYEHN